MNTTDSIKSDENTQYDACAKKFNAITERFEVSIGGTKQLKSNAAQALIELAASVKSIDEYHNVIRLITNHRPMDDQDYKNVKSAINGGFGRSRTAIEADIKKITKENNEAKKAEDAKRKAAAVQSGQILDGMKQSQLAQALAVSFSDLYKYDATAVLWYQKTGDIWVKCHDSVISGEVTRLLLENLLTGCESTTISGVIAILKNILVSGEWTTDRHLLPVRNGVINLQTGMLEEYGDTNFFWQLPYEFDEEATCPTVDKFLSQVTNGNADMQRLLVAWLWAVLYGRHDLQKFLEAIGAGGSGKSTYLSIATMLVGDSNTHSTSLEALHSDGGKFETANIMNKRLTIIPDAEEYTGGTSVLKSVTGGDKLRNERKHTQSGEGFVYTGMVMIAANSAIMSRDYSTGMTRRKISVRFDRIATDEDKAVYRDIDGGVAGAIKAEMPGLLNKLLALNEKEAIRTLTQPDGEILRQKIDGELRTNNVLRWLEESCVPCSPMEDEDFIGNLKMCADSYLYPNYADWCSCQNLSHPLSIVKFADTISDQLKARGYPNADNLKDKRPSKKNGAKGSIILGLRLRRINQIGEIRKDSDADVPGIITGNLHG